MSRGGECLCGPETLQLLVSASTLKDIPLALHIPRGREGLTRALDTHPCCEFSQSLGQDCAVDSRLCCIKKQQVEWMEAGGSPHPAWPSGEAAPSDTAQGPGLLCWLRASPPSTNLHRGLCACWVSVSLGMQRVRGTYPGMLSVPHPSVCLFKDKRIRKRLSVDSPELYWLLPWDLTHLPSLTSQRLLPQEKAPWGAQRLWEL